MSGEKISLYPKAIPSANTASNAVIPHALCGGDTRGCAAGRAGSTRRRDFGIAMRCYHEQVAPSEKSTPRR